MTTLGNIMSGLKMALGRRRNLETSYDGGAERLVLGCEVVLKPGELSLPSLSCWLSANRCCVCTNTSAPKPQEQVEEKMRVPAYGFTVLLEAGQRGECHYSTS